MVKKNEMNNERDLCKESKMEKSPDREREKKKRERKIHTCKERKWKDLWISGHKLPYAHAVLCLVPEGKTMYQGYIRNYSVEGHLSTHLHSIEHTRS